MAANGCCPYCGEFYGQRQLVRECADKCWEGRVQPLGHELAVAVLQGKIALADAERMAE
jgi:hypothetical protein